MDKNQTREVLFEKTQDGIACITLNRPDQLNAMTLDMYDQVAALAGQCSEDASVRAVVITGSGKHFCAGGDIMRFKRLMDAGQELPQAGVIKTARMAMAVRRCEKPVIAKVNGSAVGAGCALALACDFRVMDENSRLLSGFTRMGFSGDTLGWYWLSRMVGMAKTAEFYMMGKGFTAREALDLGISSLVAPAGRLDQEAEAFAAKFLELPTRALAYQKQMFNLIAYPDMEAVAAMEREFMPRCSMLKDHEEAVNAFLEKREPRFTGR